MIVHDKIRDEKCNNCGKRFLNVKCLTAHIDRVHGGIYEEGQNVRRKNKPRDLTCKICGQKVNEKLNEHVKIHRNPNDMKYHCPICDNIFKSYLTLKLHILGIHEEKKDFKCEMCLKSFLKNATLKKHILEVHGQQRSTTCERCGKAFRGPHELARHIAAVHEGVKNYKCEKCGRGFSETTGLSNHIKSIHMGIPEAKNYKCEFCEKAFPRKGRLINHIERHHGGLKSNHRITRTIQEPTVLTTSGFQASFLTSFHNKQDTPISPDKSTQLKDLLSQEPKHVDPPRHKCTFCDETFREMYYLNIHITSKHDLELNETKKPEEEEKFYPDEEEFGDDEYPEYPDYLDYPEVQLEENPDEFTLEESIDQESPIKNEYENFIETPAENEQKPKMNSATTDDDEGTEKCYFCEKTFKDKEKLEAHMNSNSCYQKEFECSFCDKIFPENYKLQRHIKFVHSKVKNAKCTMCEKEFPRKYDLERHINNVHDRDELIFRHAIIQKYFLELSIKF